MFKTNQIALLTLFVFLFSSINPSVAFSSSDYMYEYENYDPYDMMDDAVVEEEQQPEEEYVGDYADADSYVETTETWMADSLSMEAVSDSDTDEDTETSEEEYYGGEEGGMPVPDEPEGGGPDRIVSYSEDFSEKSVEIVETSTESGFDVTRNIFEEYQWDYDSSAYKLTSKTGMETRVKNTESGDESDPSFLREKHTYTYSLNWPVDSDGNEGAEEKTFQMHHYELKSKITAPGGSPGQISVIIQEADWVSFDEADEIKDGFFHRHDVTKDAGTGEILSSTSETNTFTGFTRKFEIETMNQSSSETTIPNGTSKTKNKETKTTVEDQVWNTDDEAWWTISKMGQRETYDLAEQETSTTAGMTSLYDERTKTYQLSYEITDGSVGAETEELVAKSAKNEDLDSTSPTAVNIRFNYSWSKWDKEMDAPNGDKMKDFMHGSTGTAFRWTDDLSSNESWEFGVGVRDSYQKRELQLPGGGMRRTVEEYEVYHEETGVAVEVRNSQTEYTPSVEKNYTAVSSFFDKDGDLLRREIRGSVEEYSTVTDLRFKRVYDTLKIEVPGVPDYDASRLILWDDATGRFESVRYDEDGAAISLGIDYDAGGIPENVIYDQIGVPGGLTIMPIPLSSSHASNIEGFVSWTQDIDDRAGFSRFEYIWDFFAGIISAVDYPTPV